MSHATMIVARAVTELPRAADADEGPPVSRTMHDGPGHRDIVTLRDVSAARCPIVNATMVSLAIAPDDAPTRSRGMRAELDIAVPKPVQRSVWSRRRSFLAGRASAIVAMRRHGLTDACSPDIAEHRGPRWPAGLVGSISHSAFLASAIVASDSMYLGLGLDIEDCMSDAVADSVAPHVAPEVLDGSIRIGGRPADRATVVTAVFSAKESLFKCLRPLIDDFFDFRDARMIALDFTSRRARLRLLRTLAPSIPAGLEFDVDLAIDMALLGAVDGHGPDGTIRTIIAWTG
jgi:4'-phosphopantetheinyl transferase EntD